MYAKAITTESGDDVVKVSVAGALVLLTSTDAVGVAIEILEAAKTHLTAIIPDGDDAETGDCPHR